MLSHYVRVDATCGAPAAHPDTPIGVICPYFTEHIHLTDTRITHAKRATDLALEALLRWRPVHGQHRLPAPAVDHRHVRSARWEHVRQAVGYVAAREHCTAAEALA
jgi:hypothetical protein